MNRKSFLAKIGLTVAGLALWKREIAEARPGLPPCKTCQQQAETGIARDCLYKLTSDLNAAQLLESRFPHVVSSGGWLLFSCPGVEGCNIQGTSGFVWCELHGTKGNLKAIQDVFMCSSSAYRSGIGDLYSLRLRTRHLDGADGLAACGETLGTDIVDKLRRLPVVTEWQAIHAEARSRFDRAANAERGRLTKFSEAVCQPPMQVV